jgi:hypothetical protein
MEAILKAIRKAGIDVTAADDEDTKNAVIEAIMAENKDRSRELATVYFEVAVWIGAGGRMADAERMLWETLEKRIETLNKEAGADRMEADALNKEADALNKEAGADRMEADALNREADALNKEADALNREADALNKEADALIKRIDAVRKETDALNKTADATGKERAAYRKEIDACRKETDALNKKTDASRKERAASGKERAAYELEADADREARVRRQALCWPIATQEIIQTHRRNNRVAPRWGQTTRPGHPPARIAREASLTQSELKFPGRYDLGLSHSGDRYATDHFILIAKSMLFEVARALRLRALPSRESTLIENRGRWGSFGVIYRFASGTPIGAIDVRTPPRTPDAHDILDDTDSAVLGELFDIMMELKDAFGLQQVFGILTTSVGWRIVWFDDHESNTLAEADPCELQCSRCEAPLGSIAGPCVACDGDKSAALPRTTKLQDILAAKYRIAVDFDPVIPVIDPAVVLPAIDPAVVPAIDPAVVPVIDPAVVPVIDSTVVLPAIDPAVVPVIDPAVVLPAIDPAVLPVIDPAVVSVIDPAVVPPVIDPAVVPVTGAGASSAAANGDTTEDAIVTVAREFVGTKVFRINEDVECDGDFVNFLASGLLRMSAVQVHPPHASDSLFKRRFVALTKDSLHAHQAIFPTATPADENAAGGRADAGGGKTLADIAWHTFESAADARTLFVLAFLGHGGDGDAVLACAPEGKGVCVLKWRHDGGDVEDEHAWWQKVYDAPHTRLGVWNRRPTLAMRYFAPVTVAQRREAAAQVDGREHPILAAVRTVLEVNFAGRGFRHEDIAWRNVGLYRDTADGELKAVLFDLARMSEFDDGENRELWVDNHIAGLAND